jgi:hypothetical protein
MKAQIVEPLKFFSEAELESLEFLPEELEAIEEERVPDLDSISFEDIAEDLEAILETDRRSTILNAAARTPGYMELQAKIMSLTGRINTLRKGDPKRAVLIAQRAWYLLRLRRMERSFR